MVGCAGVAGGEHGHVRGVRAAARGRDPAAGGDVPARVRGDREVFGTTHEGRGTRGRPPRRGRPLARPRCANGSSCPYVPRDLARTCKRHGWRRLPPRPRGGESAGAQGARRAGRRRAPASVVRRWMTGVRRGVRVDAVRDAHVRRPPSPDDRVPRRHTSGARRTCARRAAALPPPAERPRRRSARPPWCCDCLTTRRPFHDACAPQRGHSPDDGRNGLRRWEPTRLSWAAADAGSAGAGRQPVSAGGPRAGAAHGGRGLPR